ncbi:MAG: 3TM-type holin [Alphaproteobacteria bacterium]|nr:3TM-type holin [Alphaproteobacteria bacterium]
MGFPFLPFLAKTIKTALPQKILGFVFDIVEKVVDNKDQAGSIKGRLKLLAEENKLHELNEISKIVLAEVKSDNWLQKSWRPILMLSIMGIVINAYIIIPYLNMFLTQKIILPLPEAFFELLTFGVGGYVIGRSLENGVKKIKNRDWKGDGLY